MLVEQKSSLSHFSEDGKPIMYVTSVGFEAVIFDCPGILVSKVKTPITEDKIDEVAERTVEAATRQTVWTTIHEVCLKPEVRNSEPYKKVHLKSAYLASQTTEDLSDIFSFQRTNAKRDFDIAGAKTFPRSTPRLERNFNIAYTVLNGIYQKLQRAFHYKRAENSTRFN